jgi:predicted enzyme related to lactoylglutathione lyase
MFESLDFLYVPAPDVDRAIEYYVSTLGAELIWKVRHGGTVVANVRLSRTGPALLLAGHLEGTVPILIYRVADLDAAMAELTARGWKSDGDPFEIPQGPCVTFRDPNGQRFALYQLLRPEMNERFAGRIDP